MIDAVFKKGTGRRVQSQCNILSRTIPGSLDGFQDNLTGLLIALEVGSKATFVTNIGIIALPFRIFFNVWKTSAQ